MRNLSSALTTGRNVVKILAAVVAALCITALTACSKDDVPDGGGSVSIYVNTDSIEDHKTITFSIQNFTMSAMARTRATMSEVGMTDLWVFDYVGGTLLQTIHQTATDTNFGTPSVHADYGEHTFYFVASRGDTPSIDGSVISWLKPSDTFWGSLSLNVQPSSATNNPVTLHRVATRLRITVTDEVPDGLAKLCITPARWYYGLNILTGEATDERDTERSVSVPASYIGTTGQLTMSVFSMSPDAEWQTSVTVAAKTASDAVINSITLADVPLKRNRITTYSGTLFAASRSIAISLTDDWSDDYTATW